MPCCVPAGQGCVGRDPCCTARDRRPCRPRIATNGRLIPCAASHRCSAGPGRCRLQGGDATGAPRVHNARESRSTVCSGSRPFRRHVAPNPLSAGRCRRRSRRPDGSSAAAGDALRWDQPRVLHPARPTPAREGARVAWPSGSRDSRHEGTLRKRDWNRTPAGAAARCGQLQWDEQRQRAPALPSRQVYSTMICPTMPASR